MNPSNRIMLDTNVLVYASDGNSPYHTAAKTIGDKGLWGEIPVCLTPQVLSEFYAVVTDSRRVVSPQSRHDAIQEIEKYTSTETIELIYQNQKSIHYFIDLVSRYDVTKQGIFDLQLIATMLSNRVSRIYTFDNKDFEPFKEITVLSPESVTK